MVRRPAAGRIYIHHDPVSYGGTGMRNPDLPFKVAMTVDPVNPDSHLGVLASRATYPEACRDLAKELAWRDPKVRKLRADADRLQSEIAQREYERLIALPEPTDAEPGRSRL